VANNPVRVLEIGGHSAGYSGRLFVRSGAEVVRIEPPEMVPSWASDAATNTYLHAGKQRINTQDVRLVGELADKADVVICEASCADQIDSWDFDNFLTPIKVAITPFGRTGPKRNWHATPHVLLAMGGYTHLMGDEDKAPLSLPGHYLEFQTGALAYTVANACLYARPHRDTKDVDIGMLETVMALSQFTVVRWHCTGDVRSRHGSDFWFISPSDLFRCADGWVYLTIVPGFWDPFVVFLQRPELSVDPRFCTNDDRMAHRDVLRNIIAETLVTLSKDRIESRAEACRVPLGAVKTFSEILKDPHLDQRRFWEEIDMHVSATTVRSPGLSFRIDDEVRPSLRLNDTENDHV